MPHRCRKHKKSREGKGFRGYKSRRREGWSMNLYRNTKNKKLGGVCSGLADHFDFDPWVVRLLAIGALVMFQGLAVIAYLIAWCLLDPRPREAQEVYEYDEEHSRYRRKTMFKHPPSPSIRLHRAQERLNETLRRIEDMETYVTSRQYKINKEFAKITD